MLADIAIPSNRRFIFATLIVLLISRVCLQFFAPPLPDESYYWLWGIHLSFSYYDHPPLQAWLQGLDARLFGWNLLSLRLLTWPTTIGTIAILLWWSRRLATAVWAEYFLTTTAIYFASPLIFIYTATAVNDHLLIFLSCLSASFFALFFVEFAAHGRQSLLYLYLGAITLAFAALTKYNAVFLGLGVAVSVVVLPALRPLLKSPHIYAAAALTALIQLPVWYWNAVHDFSSFRYNLWDRLYLRDWWFSLGSIVGVFATSVFVLSPFLFAPLLGFLKSRPKGLTETIWQSLGFWTFFCSTLSFFALCLFTYVHFYWNIEAYLLFFPAAAMYLSSSRVLRAHLVYGMIFSVLFAFNYTVLPLAALVTHADLESARVFGWAEIGTRVASAKAKYHAKFIAASNWQTASELAFALQDPAVECFVGKSQFTFWFNNDLRDGQDAIVLVDEPELPDVNSVIGSKFRRVEPIDTIQVKRFGKLLATYQIYLGVAYIGKAS
jgi:hypothetical protein